MAQGRAWLGRGGLHAMAAAKAQQGRALQVATARSCMCVWHRSQLVRQVCRDPHACKHCGAVSPRSPFIPRWSPTACSRQHQSARDGDSARHLRRSPAAMRHRTSTSGFLCTLQGCLVLCSRPGNAQGCGAAPPAAGSGGGGSGGAAAAAAGGRAAPTAGAHCPHAAAELAGGGCNGQCGVQAGGSHGEQSCTWRQRGRVLSPPTTPAAVAGH